MNGTIHAAGALLDLSVQDRIIYLPRLSAIDTLTDSTVQLKIIDTTGNKENGYAIYMNIEIKVNQDSIEYGLKCEEHNSDGIIILSLVEAYNKTRITGGYSKEAKGVEPLVDNFEANFLTPSQHTRNIKIDLMPSRTNRAFSLFEVAGISVKLFVFSLQVVFLWYKNLLAHSQRQRIGKPAQLGLPICCL